MASNDNDDLVDGLAHQLLMAARGRAEASSFGALERTLLEISNQALRLALESALQQLADNEGEAVEVGESRYRRHQRATVTYHSLCG